MMAWSWSFSPILVDLEPPDCSTHTQERGYVDGGRDGNRTAFFTTAGPFHYVTRGDRPRRGQHAPAGAGGDRRATRALPGPACPRRGALLFRDDRALARGGCGSEHAALPRAARRPRVDDRRAQVVDDGRGRSGVRHSH